MKNKLNNFFVVSILFVSLAWPIYASLPFVEISPYFVLYKLALIYALFLISSSGEFWRYLLSNRHLFRCFILVSAYFSWRLVSVFFSDKFLDSLGIFFREFYYYYCPFIIAINYSASNNYSTVRNVVLLCSFIVTIFGAAEYFSENSVLMSILPKSTDDAEYLNMLEYDQSRDGGYRARSVYVHSLVYAEFIGIYCIFLLNFTEKNTIGFAKFLFYGVFLVVSFSIIFTGTRSSFFGLFVGLAAYKFFEKICRPRVDYIFISMKAIVLATILFFGIYFASDYVAEIVSGRTQEEVSSSQARELMYNLGLNAIIDRPIFGYGPGQLEIAAIEGLGGKLTLDSHILAISIESGIVGLFLFFMQFLFAIYLGIFYGNKKILPVFIGVFCVCLVYAPVLFMTYAYIVLYMMMPFVVGGNCEHED